MRVKPTVIAMASTLIAMASKVNLNIRGQLASEAPFATRWTLTAHPASEHKTDAAGVSASKHRGLA